MNDEQAREPRHRETESHSDPPEAERARGQFPEQAPLTPAEIWIVELHARLDDLARLVGEQPRVLSEAEPGAELDMYDRVSECEVQMLVHRLIRKVRRLTCGQAHSRSPPWRCSSRMQSREVQQRRPNMSDAQPTRESEGAGPAQLESTPHVGGTRVEVQVAPVDVEAMHGRCAWSAEAATMGQALGEGSSTASAPRAAASGWSAPARWV
jgi:hypothetical protein